MNNKNKLKIVDIKVFVISFTIITIMLFIVSKVAINNIKYYYYNLMKMESLNLAKSYSHSLAKASEAYEIVNELLEGKLHAASKVTALYDGHHSNLLLKELAESLEIDEIYSYNPQGEIIFSNVEKYIGWKAYEGHPVYDFMISNEQSLVGEIRQDSESGVYYKYGYFRRPNGHFVQIGILADKIQSFLSGFEIQQLLEELGDDGVVTQICFIDNDFNVLGSTEPELIGTQIKDRNIKVEINRNREVSVINDSNGDKIYQVFVPIYFKGQKAGVLAIGQSLRETEAIIRQISIIGFSTLLIIFVSLFYAMASTYNKNKRLIKLAYYDVLTGLPSKEYLNEFLAEEIERNKSNRKAILLINCINFRTINLTFGFQYGDKILQEIAYKLKELENPYRRLFKFTENRFVLYVDNYNARSDLIILTNMISKIFNEPFSITDINQFVGVKIGIVEIDSKCKDVDQLLKDASISLTHVKENDTKNYAFYSEEMEDRLQREETIERELRAALSNQNTETLFLQYQPQVDLRTNEIIGFEALARMGTESLGSISPIEFIDIAERKQLIVPLGTWILKTACKFIGTLNMEGYKEVKVSVNISGIQLLQDDFTDIVIDIIKEAGIKESNLALEITESVILDSFDIINNKLKQLRDLGIEIALDDFGTGYSSLSRIRELNMDYVKIDKDFISKIPLKPHNELITEEIISMSHKLGLMVVAEGVEVEEQREYLVEKNCDIVQGYLFSRPLDKEAALQILNRRN